MAIMMTKTVKGSANQYGNETRTYNEGEEIVIDAPWKQTLADNFLAAGLAKETKVVSPTDTSSQAPERARNADGTLKADDPSTPDVNEAWEGGKKPAKRKTVKKK